MLTPAGKIVVFDPVPGNLDELLRGRGFDVAGCRAPEEIVEAVVRFRPETLVVNVTPAPGAAFEATRRVKSFPAAAVLPVLHVAPAGSEAAVRSLECADAWLPESVDPEVLAAGVSALVRRFRTHATAVAADVADRKQAEEALRESEMRYRLLCEANPIGVARSVISGRDCGRMLDANDAWLSITGYGREDLEAGRLNWQELTPPEYLPVSRAAAAKTAETGHSGLYEKEYIRRDGRRVPVIIGCTVIGDDREQAVAFVIDISERKRLEAQFQEVQKMESIGVLAGGVAHDFNNLLTTILGNASLIAETVPEDSPDFARVQQIVLSAEYAADLTRQLLAYAGKARLVPAEMDISDTVRDIARLARSFVPSDVELELDLGSGIPAVRADRNQMHQVLMNLLLNASESCGLRGAIRVRTAARIIDRAEAGRTPMHASPGRYAVLEVRDNGSGIDPAMLPRIFDPFFTTKFSGRGLGLAAVQGIVRSHRGFIEVESAPGAGSCFRVMLPALPEAAE